MSVAVITPYHQTPSARLQQCLDSVARQSLPCAHIIVCDGENPIGVELSRDVQIVRLPKPNNDRGNTARAVGSAIAIGQGFGAIAYLDPDNWYEPEHLARLWSAHQQTGAIVCSAARNLVDLDGNLLGLCPEVDGERFVDKDCLLITRQAYGCVSTWYLMPRERIPVAEQELWRTIKNAKVRRAHSDLPTVWHRTKLAAHYRHFGKEPPVEIRAEPVPDKRSRPRGVVSIPASPPVATVPTVVSAIPRSDESGYGQARQLAPQASRKQTISLCMIVKNEEHNIGDCLASVLGLFDEIIVVDTGCTDRTADIARQHQARVVPFTWIDHFAAARNEGVKHATSDWIFWMDADDRFDANNRERFLQLRSQLPEDNVAYMMKQWSFSDQQHGSPLMIDHVRLFRKQPGAAWRYRIHEQILIPLQELGARIVFTDIVIQHLGYQDTALRRRKQQRNLRLLEIEVAEQPDDPFTLFNLAGTYLDMGEHDKAMPYLLKSVEKSPPGASFLAKSYVCLTQTYRHANRLDQAMHFCQRGRKAFPHYLELSFQEGLTYLALKNPVAAQHSFETVLRSAGKPGPQFVGVTEGVLGHITRHHLALAMRGQRKLRTAEQQLRRTLIEAGHYGPAWLTLADLLLEQTRLPDLESLIAQAQDQQNATIAAALQARLNVGQKDIASARKVLEDALTRDPDNLWLRLFLSDILVRHGQHLDAAANHLQRILAADPGQSQARSMLDKIKSWPTQVTVNR